MCKSITWESGSSELENVKYQAMNGSCLNSEASAVAASDVA